MFCPFSFRYSNKIIAKGSKINKSNKIKAFLLDILISFFEVNFVILWSNFVFGRKIITPIKAKRKYAIAVANAFVFPIMSATRKVSVKVPRSAPSMKGIAFFRLMSLATARGTSKPIVILEEKTMAVSATPRK